VKSSPRYALLFALALSCSKKSAPPTADAGALAAVPDAAPAPSTAVAPAEVDAGAVAAVKPPAAPRKWKRVLHLGDSMVGFRFGLTMALASRFKKQGAKFRSDSLTSAQVQDYDKDHRMVRLIKETKPDLVILNLGTNNVQNPHPEALAGSIRALVKKMEGRDCYWLGPPLPIKGLHHDTGIRKVIADNVAPCKFFDTAKITTIERQKDRVHPTDRGGGVWAEAVFDFIVEDAPSQTVDDFASDAGVLPTRLAPP
jgi:hypothetical protein